MRIPVLVLALPAVSSLLVACGPPSSIPKQDFAVWGANVLCQRTRDCMRGSYEASYYSMADCLEHNERDLLALVDLMDSLNCDYDADQAGQAYDEVAEMTCENFYEGEASEATTDIWGDCFGFTFPPYTYF